MLVSLLFIPTDTRFAIAGFFLFRIFDAIKIPPADEVEKFKGAKGIVGDDLVAGIYANLMLHGLRLTLKIFS
jgi:phosphatidylglycerophosphatase A